jgi:hypothetical protein
MHPNLDQEHPVRSSTGDSGVENLGSYVLDASMCESPVSSLMVIPSKNTKPYEDDNGKWCCNECPAKYSGKFGFSNCVRHINGKHGMHGGPPRIFRCPDCERTDSRPDNLRTHMTKRHGYTVDNMPHVDPEYIWLKVFEG